MTQPLAHLEPRWVTLRADSDGLPAVVLLDEAVALACPFPELPVQLGVGVHLRQPDQDGQPGLTERPQLRAFEKELVTLLAPVARLVATLTLRGVREYVLYARDAQFLAGWRPTPPPELASHDFEVRVVQDPKWLGLREMAGLLGEGEEPLR